MDGTGRFTRKRAPLLVKSLRNGTPFTFSVEILVFTLPKGTLLNYNAQAEMEGKVVVIPDFLVVAVLFTDTFRLQLVRVLKSHAREDSLLFFTRCHGRGFVLA
jgi:hypothetical protein